MTLARLRRSGLDFARILADPGPFLSFIGAQRRDLLDALDAAVAQALGADLGVVVNIQASGTHYWSLGAHECRRHSGAGLPWRARLPALVGGGDVAGDRLAGRDRSGSGAALEPINEPQQVSPARRISGRCWVQMALLGAVLAAAPALTLVATGACGSMIPGLRALDPALVLVFLGRASHLPFLRSPISSRIRARLGCASRSIAWLNAVPWPGFLGRIAGGNVLAAVRRAHGRGQRNARGGQAQRL